MNCFIRQITLLSLICFTAFILRGIKCRRDREKSIWDLSSWKVENIEDLRNMAIDMYVSGVDFDVKGTRTRSVITRKQKQLRLESVINRIEDRRMNRNNTKSSLTRRLRSRNQVANDQERGQRLVENNKKGQKNKWNEDAEDMKGELMQYFLSKTGKKQQSPKNIAAIKAMQQYMRVIKKSKRDINTLNRQSKALDTQRRTSEYTWENPYSLNCTDPDSDGLKCPPEDLPQKCDKYNGGSMEKCYQLCKESFCCIHDSTSETLNPSCSQELNCKNWQPCYIVWWKLHDTIGPLTFIRIEQRESFFDIDFQYILDDATTGDGDGVSEFYNQLFFHHWDSDEYKNDLFVEDPANW